MGASCGTSCAGKRRCAKLPTRGSRSPRSRLRPSGCGSARWSHRCPDAGRSRSPARPRPWTGSAAAASPSASGSAVTASLASSRRPASSSTNGPGARCSTRHWRSSPPPGAVSRFTTTATTTRSTTSSSSPGRCSDPTSRYGLRAFPATSSRCGEPPDTTGSFPPISRTPINSPRSLPSLPSSRRRDGTVRHRRRPPRWRGSHAFYVEAGATWWLPEFAQEAVSIDRGAGRARRRAVRSLTMCPSAAASAGRPRMGSGADVLIQFRGGHR